MRKVLSLLVVALFAFGMMSCNQAKNEADNDQAILDSIAKVEAEQAVTDSIAAVEKAAMEAMDTIKAEVEEVIEEVIN